MVHFLAVAVAGSVVIVVFAVMATVPNYRVAPTFLLPALWAAIPLRRWLDLSAGHYLLFALAIILHDLGSFGYYQREVLGRPFDNWVHFYFGLVAALILWRALRHRLGLGGSALALTTLMYVMGAGAIHELMEYLSWVFLGDKGGMVKTTIYVFDTQRDLTNNLWGCLLGLAIAAVSARLAKRRAQDSKSEISNIKSEQAD